MIKINLNKELDYEVYVDFHNHSRAGADFGEKIKKDHPNISLENYKKYIDDFYVSSQAEILGKEEKLFYSNLKDKLDRAKEIWSSSKDMKIFVGRYLMEINN